jgi:hypothetical protein
MSSPAYADLGKSAKDLFNKGFNHGFFKVDTKTKTYYFIKSCQQLFSLLVWLALIY